MISGPTGPLVLTCSRPARGARDKAAATRPELSFSARARLPRLPACSRASGRVQKVPGAAQSFPGRGEWVGGPSRERTPAGRGGPGPNRLCPRWPQPGVRCRRRSCDLPPGCARRERPRVPAPPGGEGGGPAQSGAEPRAEGALTLAGQVGGGGAVLQAAAGRRRWGPFKAPTNAGPEGGREGRELLEGLRPARETPQREDAVRTAWLESWSRATRVAGAKCCSPRGRTAAGPGGAAFPKKPAGGGASSRPLPGLQRGCPQPPLGSFPSGRARGKEGGERGGGGGSWGEGGSAPTAGGSSSSSGRTGGRGRARRGPLRRSGRG